METIINFTYCCELFKNLCERHIHNDCEDCMKEKKLKKNKDSIVLRGLNMPCSKHIIYNPLKDMFQICDHQNSIGELYKSSDSFFESIERLRCDCCKKCSFKDNIYPRNYHCMKCKKTMCMNCFNDNMLTIQYKDGSVIPLTYVCFDCAPKEKLEAIRLKQITI